MLNPAINAILRRTSLNVGSRAVTRVSLAQYNLYMGNHHAPFAALALSLIIAGWGASLVALGLIRTSMVKPPASHVHVKLPAARTTAFHV